MPPLHALIYLGMMVAACVFTFWAGGRTERVGMAIVIIASLASYPAATLMRHRWQTMMPANFAIDLATTLAFLILMMRSRRYWPIWSVGFCLAMMMAHFVRLARTSVPGLAYLHTTAIWGYPVMAVIAIGAVRHRWGRTTPRF